MNSDSEISRRTSKSKADIRRTDNEEYTKNVNHNTEAFFGVGQPQRHQEEQIIDLHYNSAGNIHRNVKNPLQQTVTKHTL